MSGFLLAQLVMETGLGGLDIEQQSGTLAASGRTVLSFSPQEGSYGRVVFLIALGPMIPNTIQFMLTQGKGIRPKTFTVSSAVIATGIPLWTYANSAAPLRVQVTNTNATGSMPYDLTIYSLDVVTDDDFRAIKGLISGFRKPTILSAQRANPTGMGRPVKG